MTAESRGHGTAPVLVSRTEFGGAVSPTLELQGRLSATDLSRTKAVLDTP